MRMSVSFGTGFSLGPMRKDMIARLQKGASRATAKAATGARDEIRTVMKGQRLGKLSNAVKATSDLKKGYVHQTGDGGFSVSGTVFVSAKNARTAGAFEAYTRGAVITPKRGRWLAIPTPEIQRLVRVPLPRTGGGRGYANVRNEPDLYRRTIEARLGPLTFVPGKHAGVAYLVIKDTSMHLSKQGKLRGIGKSGRVGPARARVGVVAFVLIRSTKRAARLNPDTVVERWRQKLPRLLQAELE